MVSQLWGNKDQSGVTTPVVTVTYGGTKEPSDLAVSSFPASVQNVKMGYPIITYGLLSMMHFFFPKSFNVSSDLNAINGAYGMIIPAPPVFGDTLPQIPVFNYYSR